MIGRVVVLLCAVLALAGCRPPADVEPLACRNAEAGEAQLGMGDLDTGFVAAPDGSTTSS